uniref:MARVEL domain-containing protein n=1 Tax=Syphacia muris TaxID=451379 RepID=A0A0N5AWP7_9BILA
MPTLRQETYTTAQPDGTLVTTTTKTRTQYVYGGSGYTFGRGPVAKRYFSRPSSIIRILEVVLGLIIVALVTSVFGPGPFKGILFGQTFLLIFTGIAICISFIFLDFVFSIAACLLLLIMGFFEAYYATGAWSNYCSEIGSDGFLHAGCRTIYEWAFASFFCFVLAILYAFGAMFARRYNELD